MLFVALELWYPQKRLEKLVYFEILCNSIALERRRFSNVQQFHLFGRFFRSFCKTQRFVRCLRHGRLANVQVFSMFEAQILQFP